MTHDNRDNNRDRSDVQAAIERMTEAFHRGDIDAVMACYEPTATIVFEPEMPVTDPTAQRAGFERFFGLQPRFEYAGHEVFVAGDNAIHIAPWTMTGKTPDGPITQRGMSIAALRRQPDGSWLMTIDDPFGSHLLGSS